jgi:hypothetical protein
MHLKAWYNGFVTMFKVRKQVKQVTRYIRYGKGKPPSDQGTIEHSTHSAAMCTTGDEVSLRVIAPPTSAMMLSTLLACSSLPVRGHL